jgi:hypothetical protein
MFFPINNREDPGSVGSPKPDVEPIFSKFMTFAMFLLALSWCSLGRDDLPIPEWRSSDRH